MNALTFRVRGSRGDLYVVQFETTDGKLRASCTCPAGMKRQTCKHSVALMEGNTTALVSENVDEIEILRRMLKETRAEAALENLRDAQKAFAAAESELQHAKKALARAIES